MFYCNCFNAFNLLSIKFTFLFIKKLKILVWLCSDFFLYFSMTCCFNHVFDKNLLISAHHSLGDKNRFFIQICLLLLQLFKRKQFDISRLLFNSSKIQNINIWFVSMLLFALIFCCFYHAFHKFPYFSRSLSWMKIDYFLSQIVKASSLLCYQ